MPVAHNVSSPSLRDLIADALTICRAAPPAQTVSREDAKHWPLLEGAAKHGPALDVGLQLLKSDDIARRVVGVDLLEIVADRFPDHRSIVAKALLDLIVNSDDDGFGTHFDSYFERSITGLSTQAAVRALGATREIAAIPTLLELIEEDDRDSQDLRCMAIESLGRIQANGAHTADGVDGLLRVMSDSEPGIRRRGTYGLPVCFILTGPVFVRH